MIRVVEHMPPGTIGVEARGKITEEDYRDVLVPTVEAALTTGDVRLLYVLDEGAEYSAGAMWADSKLWTKHLKSWSRVAVVSDAEWLERLPTFPTRTRGLKAATSATPVMSPRPLSGFSPCIRGRTQRGGRVS